MSKPKDNLPAGKLMQAILAGFVQFDRDVRAERIKAGLCAKKRRKKS